MIIETRGMARTIGALYGLEMIVRRRAPSQKRLILRRGFLSASRIIRIATSNFLPGAWRRHSVKCRSQLVCRCVIWHIALWAGFASERANSARIINLSFFCERILG